MTIIRIVRCRWWWTAHNPNEILGTGEPPTYIRARTRERLIEKSKKRWGSHLPSYQEVDLVTGPITAQEQPRDSLRDAVILAITDGKVSWGYISEDPHSSIPGPMMTTRDALLDALGMTLDEVFAESNRLRFGEQKAAGS